MILKIFVAIILALIINQVSSTKCQMKDDEFFVTFHPHLDAFWLNTDDQLKNIHFQPAGFLYAMNQRNSKTILNSMYEALTKKADRKYFVSQIVFFKDWYEYITEKQRNEVKRLIQNGQLQIPNGGWVQNDEAVCYFDDILDQYTIGHNFMYSQFGVETKIAWATDSFGHSHSQVALQHILGIEFQGIERIDDRYIYDRKDGHKLEFYWSPVSDSNNRKYGGVLTYVRHFLHEVNDLRSLSSSSIADDFRQIQNAMKKLYDRTKLFRFLGNDFEQFIPKQFENLQAAFTLLNSQTLNACPKYKYGNPSDYLDQLKNYYVDTPKRQFDFMPNYDQDHYWSGYYTTDPDLKKICKDFSRLVNLYRKILLKYAQSSSSLDTYRKTLVSADELLSIMQHHDGITATSKFHIQKLFKDRMKTKSQQILNHINKIKNFSSKKCNLYQNFNTCILINQEDVVYFTILHQGAPKKQRVQILINSALSYDVQNDQTDNVICNIQTNICYLVFQPSLVPGQNSFVLKKVQKQKQISSEIIQNNVMQSTDFRFEISGNSIKYRFNGNEQIIVTLVKSSNRQTSTSTYTWSKYGRRIDKNENRMPGIYIMANDGIIRQLNLQNVVTSIAKGTLYTKIFITSKAYSFILTIKNSQKNIIDLQTVFLPQTRQMNDFFLKIDSSIKGNDEFYHDMNGYLVSKRKIGSRPDYNWIYKQEDKINANTYPMCSFAYVIQDNKKIVVFSDRAQGIAKYDKSLLINIDRLASDDYKGVGQGYFYAVKNTFNHKIGIVQKKLNIEREWQKNYDDGLIGYYSEAPRSEVPKTDIPLTQLQKYLKYTVFFLNKDEYVLRIINLHEQQNLYMPVHTSKQWIIPELSLNLSFQDIKQSFANGIPHSERRVWVKIQEQTNIFNGGSKDTLSDIVLSPLQIRSFRINTKNVINPSHQSSAQKSPLANLKLNQPQPVKAKFTKRCF